MPMDTVSNLNIHALSSQAAVDFTVMKATWQLGAVEPRFVTVPTSFGGSRSASEFKTANNKQIFKGVL